jgi:hypothetical protein
MKKYVMTILIILVSVLVGYMFIVLCSIPSHPLFPFDIQKTNGDREQGTVVLYQLATGLMVSPATIKSGSIHNRIIL